ncbi:DegV family protein [Brochothrix thermosphacta]|uniref:DegV family protein n=1 Tax=Brochothrix thermosphacta TaxID=2756 RepID=UPI000D0E897D|nr:DegV family protein [Brochothrix thermosphacta]SOC31326.1 conserved hypothetical protein [Brochothrix thermosphacta]
MPNIKIVTDSTAGLTTKEIENFNITVLPLTVSLNGEEWVPDENMDYEGFIDQMEAAKELPRTSQPAIGKMVEALENLTADGSSVIVISLTEKLSGTVTTFQQAADMVSGDVTVVDSKFISRALAFQVIEAGEMAKAGATKEAILERVKFIQEHTKLFIVVLNLDNLAKGGRIGKMTSAIGHLLSIKLIAELGEGGLEAKAKVRSEKQIIKFFNSHFECVTENVKYIDMMHAMNNELSEKVANSIKVIKPQIKEIPQFFVDPIIATHAGKGAVAVMYCTE